MNDLIAVDLFNQLKILNKTLDCIAKDIKIIARGDLK